MSDPLLINSPLENMGQKPASPLGSPAIVQHMAFWIPEPDISNREAWIKRIEQFVIRLHKAIPIEKGEHDREVYTLRNKYPLDANGNVLADQGELITQDPTRYETVRLSGLWNSLPTNITVQLHNEYFTVSLAIDMANGNNAIATAPNTPYATLQQSLGTLDTVLNTRLQTIQTQNERVDKTADRLSLNNAYQSLYYDAWDSINDAIITPALNATIIQEPDGTTRGIGELVGDFRGLLVSRGQGENFIALPQQSDKTKTEPPVLRDVLHGNPFDADEDINMVDTIMPFMLADPHLADADDSITGKPPFESLEHTFSMLHRRRAIYASALGINKRKPHLKKLPLTYFVLSTHQERWQLGRLIESLHTAGTTRIAAMMSLGEVERANEDLRGVEVELGKIASNMPHKLKTDHENGDGASISDQLVDATAKLAAASDKVTNGLSRRAERSRYYLLQFQQNVENLDVKRIEGFQPYDRLVRHLFGSAHNFIRMTGERFIRLQERIRKMDEQVQTAEQVKTEKESSRYLEKAELFAYLALMPYYVPYALSKALSLIWKEEFGSSENSKGQKIMTVAMFGFAALLLRKEIHKNYTELVAKIKRYKNQKTALVRIKWNKINNTTQLWRDAKNELSLRVYFKLAYMPSRAIERLKRIKKRILKTPRP